MEALWLRQTGLFEELLVLLSRFKLTSPADFGGVQWNAPILPIRKPFKQGCIVLLSLFVI